MCDLFTVLLIVYSETFFFQKNKFFMAGACSASAYLPAQTLCAVRILKTLVSIIKNYSERPVGFFFVFLSFEHDT